MITTKLWLDKRRADAQKAFPLKLCLVRHGKAAYIGMDIRLLPNQWDGEHQKIVEHPNKAKLQFYIDSQKTRIDNVIHDLIIQGRLTDLTITQIKNLVSGIINPEIKGTDLFLARFKAYTDTRKAARTKAIYNATIEHMVKFDPRIGTKGFNDITRSWLTEFDVYLSESSPSRNARNIHFRNIRAVFNAAIDDNITTYYPFRKFKLHDEETRKRNLTKEQMQYLMSYPCEERDRKYIDCFLLSFYLSGINGVDLLNLTEENIVNGRVEYKRSKTGTLMSVKIEPEAQEIIDRYRGRKLLLRWNEHRKSYKSFMMQMDKCLSGLIPRCTAYYARHTIASLADELEIPEGIIGRILGHKDKSHAVTMIYINPLQSKADKACRRIFDYIKKDAE